MAKGHTRWRGNSIEVRVYIGQGRTETDTVRWQGSRKATSDAADRRLREMLGDLDVGTYGGPDATVATLIARWRSHSEHEWSPTTRAARESYLRLHILPALGDRKVREVRTADLDDFYRELHEKGLSPATIRRSIHVLLRTAFGEAVRWRWITVNPAAEARPPKAGLALPDLRPPTRDEVWSILSFASDDFYAYLVVAADTGARRGEVCALRWRAVDLDKAELLIEKAVVLDGKNVVEKDTKTHQNRRVALGPAAVAVLREHRVHVLERAMQVGARVGADSYLFSPDLDGARPWRPDGVTARFMKLRDRAGLPTVRLHDLRHALVTDWLAGGEDPRTVMGRVGHSSLQTLSRYAHFVPAKDRDAADRLGQRPKATEQG